MGLSIHSAVLSGSSSQQQWFLFSFTWRCVFISRRIIVTSSNNGTGTIANRYDSLIHKVIKKLVFIYVANPAMWFANALLIKKHLRRFNTFWRITRSGKKFRNTLSRSSSVSFVSILEIETILQIIDFLDVETLQSINHLIINYIYRNRNDSWSNRARLYVQKRFLEDFNYYKEGIRFCWNI